MERIKLTTPEVTPEVRVTQLDLAGASFRLAPPELVIILRDNTGRDRAVRYTGAEATTRLQVISQTAIARTMLELALTDPQIDGALETVTP
ncbi:MAG TPA: hypothetical protein VEL28_20055 [Candidatus Binatia bacterium]|nr:hypothetical protein [Candidatus Binatia bacterium]